MAAKIDQEFIIKNRFWILLGLAVPLVLVSLLILWTSVASAIQAERDAVEKSKDALNKISNPKNDKWVDSLKAVDEKIAGKKNEVWAKAWRAQQNIMTWPRQFARFSQQYPYFGDPITDADRADFANGTYYTDQFYNDLWAIVDPVDPRPEHAGEGYVQFKGSWESVIQPMRDWVKLPPSSEDIWLAQEDIWVKRELLRVVRDANDSVAIFQGPKKPEAAPDKKKLKIPADEEIVDYQVFTNPYWQTNLALTRKQDHFYVRGSITNRGTRRQPLGMYLMVRVQRGADFAGSVPVAVDGDPLAVNETQTIYYRDLKETKPSKDASPVDRYNPTKLYGVKQLLTWRTAPVKRIDMVVMDYPGQRISNRALKPWPGFAPKPEEGGADPNAAPSPTPAMPGVAATGSSDTGDRPGGMGGMMGMGMTNANVTDNGLQRDRYIDVNPVNPTVRRMPVALVLVVDQQNISEALAAFANSKLRIQTVQAHWERVHENLEPQVNEGPVAAGGGGDSPALGAGGRMPGMAPGAGGFKGRGSGPMMRMPSLPAMGETGSRDSGDGPSGMRGMRYPGSGGMKFGGTPGGYNMFGSTTETEEEDLSLVSLSLYGIASLYSRYPPKAPPAGAEGGTPAPGAPTATPGESPAAPATTPPAPATPAPAGQAAPATPPADTNATPPAAPGTPPTPPATTPSGVQPTTPAAPGATPTPPPAAPTTPPPAKAEPGKGS